MLVIVSQTDDGTSYRVQVEIRRGRFLEATIPRDVAPLELEVFIQRLKSTVERKWREPG